MQDTKPTAEFTNYSNNEKLFELDKEFADFFIQNLPQELDKLEQFVALNDESGIRFQAHKMAPTLKMMNNEKAVTLLKTLSKIEIDNESLQQIATDAITEVKLAISNLKQS